MPTYRKSEKKNSLVGDVGIEERSLFAPTTKQNQGLQSTILVVLQYMTLKMQLIDQEQIGKATHGMAGSKEAQDWQKVEFMSLY